MTSFEQQLLGPPEIHKSPIISTPKQNPAVQSSSLSRRFVDLFINVNNKSSIEGRTENGSATYYSAGNPLVDFFFHIVPHQIIASLEEDEENCDVAELQWRRMVDDLSKNGKLKDCIAICDVSGSMTGTPMDVCVALGLLISEMSEDPWKGKVITFSSTPQLHKIQGDDLRSKTNFIREMQWGFSTNFQKVFDQILKVAVEGKLKEEQMIKRLFVFSDMEFDKASQNDWETDYQVIQRKFRKSGYTSVPEIVFWNLRDSKATPVKSDQKGVALVSGFSKNLLKLFLQGSIDDMIPEFVMEKAISGNEYSELVVVD